MYVRYLLEERKSGELMVTIQELESYVKEQLGDSNRNISLCSLAYLPEPPELAFLFDTTLQKHDPHQHLDQIACLTWYIRTALWCYSYCGVC